MAVLYMNTVEPRIAELETRGALILARGETSESIGDFPIVVRVTDNTSDGILRIRRMREQAGLPDIRDDEAALHRLNLTRSYWNLAARYLRTRYDHKVMAVRSPGVPTSFGRIDRGEAVGLILHGYPSTMIALANSAQAPSARIRPDRFERLLDLRPGDEPGLTADEVT
jgi:hypothetical protein